MILCQWPGDDDRVIRLDNWSDVVEQCVLESLMPLFCWYRGPDGRPLDGLYLLRMKLREAREEAEEQRQHEAMERRALR